MNDMKREEKQVTVEELVEAMKEHTEKVVGYI